VARQRIGSAKQVSKLSLGQDKHGQNITTPLYELNCVDCKKLPFWYQRMAV